MSSPVSLRAQVPLTALGQRLDQAVAEMFPDYSRSRLQGWIKSGQLLVDGKSCKAKAKLIGGEWVSLEAEVENQGAWHAEDIALDLVYEDEHILVINKPAGLVVHPAAGNWSGTLLNGLLHYHPQIEQIPRAGIVHRLDKDTSGLMVVAKTLKAQLSLVEQLQARTVSREYMAITCGALTGNGEVTADIGRHPTQRIKMAVVKQGGKFARTHYRLMESFSGFSLVQLKLETGRTHQIRVHMAYMGYPLVGDGVYGRRIAPAQRSRSALWRHIDAFPRQALHAKALSLIHPASGETCSWQVPMADDIEQLLAVLRENS